MNISAIVWIFILCALPVLIVRSRMSRMNRVLTILDLLLVLGCFLVYAGSTLRLGYGREFFHNDCRELREALQSGREVEAAAALKENLDYDTPIADVLRRGRR